MRRIKVKGIYRHFKGLLVMVEDIALDSETQEKMVVYRELVGKEGLWVRPLDMFLSEVDKKKYPNIKFIDKFGQLKVYRDDFKKSVVLNYN